MQPLLAPPRDHLTETQVRGLLTGGNVAVGFGAELVDTDLAFLEDISGDLVSGTVRRNMNSPVHGTVDLQLARVLAWGRDRVRPYLILSDGTVTARWNLGVYLLTTPDLVQGQNPPVYQVSGFDLLSFMQRLIGDSYSVAAGSLTLQAVRDVVTASGVGVPILLDTTAEAATFPGRVWPYLPESTVEVDEGQASAPSWLRVANDLLASVGYRGLWADWDGRLRSGPYVQPSVQPVEFPFVVDDPLAGVVELERTVNGDVWGAPNRWTFYANGLSSTPVEGVSMYVKDNINVGLSSQSSIGVVPAAPRGLDAASYASLVVQGDRIAAADMRVTQKIQAKLGPFPALWHSDVASWVDPDLGVLRVHATGWEQPLGSGSVSVSWEVVSA